MIDFRDIDDVYCLETLNNDDIVSGNGLGQIKIWNQNTGKILTSKKMHQEFVSVLCVYKDDVIISGDRNGIISLWNITNNFTNTFIGHKDFVKSLKTSKTLDNVLFSSSLDETIIVWDINEGIIIKKILNHTGPIESIVVLPNILISSSWDKTIKIWNLTDYSLIRVLIGHENKINSITILPNNYLASASVDQTIRIWDINTGDIIAKRNYNINKFRSLSLAVLSNDRLAIASDRSNEIGIMNYKTIKLIDIIEEDHYVSSLAVLKNGNLVNSQETKIFSPNIVVRQT